LKTPLPLLSAAFSSILISVGEVTVEAKASRIEKPRRESHEGGSTNLWAISEYSSGESSFSIVVLSMTSPVSRSMSNFFD